MEYAVEIAPAAERQIRKLARPVQGRIFKRLSSLRHTPRPPGAEKITSSNDLFRIRVGDYRIIYQVKDDVLLVLVVKVARRDEAYRRILR